MMNLRARPVNALSFILGLTLLTSCVLEQIDNALEEHGVTFSSSGSDDGGDASTSTSGLDESTQGTTSGLSSVMSSTSSPDDDSTTHDSHSPSDINDSSGATEEPGPVCGNGVLEGDEFCDDGNDTPGDGCQKCATDSLVFVSSQVYQGFDLGGLDGADQRCRSLAAIAELARPESFRAWLSTANISAESRLFHSPGRYVLVNGLMVARDWDALVMGELDNLIELDEYGNPQDNGVWTGTNPNGQPALGSEFCGDWEVGGGIQYGGAGQSAYNVDSWTFYVDSECGSQLLLYCFQQPPGQD